jgi:hypothetical protein
MQPELATPVEKGICENKTCLTAAQDRKGLTTAVVVACTMQLSFLLSSLLISYCFKRRKICVILQYPYHFKVMACFMRHDKIPIQNQYRILG